jgi:RNA polymerase sigma factor (sigma-70 family)
MTDLLSDVETPSDAELISRVRGGDVAAYGELFSRHKDAARRLARQLVRGPDSDDLVSDAFAKVLTVLQGGGGPDVAFRAYLLTAVRRLHVDRVRSGQRLQTTDDLTPFDPGVPFQDTAVAGFESGAAAKAFASLPERWQLVLWHLEVEGQKPAEIAPLLGMSANSVSALAYRAREGLRQAFLTMHISDLTETDCRWVNEHLGAFVRRGLSKRDAGKVQAHLDECRRCTGMYLELTEVNSNLAGIIAPLLLGAAAAGYLATSGGVTAAGVLGLLAKAKEIVVANTGAVTAAGVAGGVATAAAVAAVTISANPAHKQPVVAEPPAAVSTSPGAPAAALPTKPATSSTNATPSATTSSASASPSVSPSLTPSESPSPSDSLSPTDSLSPSDSTSPSDTATASPTDVPPNDLQTDTPAPSDGETSGPTPVTVSTVDLSGTTVDEQGVHFRAVGSPDLPPLLTVRLTSQPSGVTFAATGGDCRVADDGLSAVCSTVSGGTGGTVPGAATTATPSTYTAELPFVIPDGLGDTDLDVAVDVPEGFEVSGGSAGQLQPYTSRAADVRLALDSPVDYADGGYAVVAHLSGIPADYTGPVRLSTVGPTVATITGSPTPGCTVDAGDLVCRQPVGTVTVVVDAADPSQATEIRLRVGSLAGYRDPAGTNNASAATLNAKPGTPDADLALTLDTPSRVAGLHRVTGHVSGLPTGYTGTLTYTLSGNATFADDGSCTPVAKTLVCDVTAGGDQAFLLKADDNGHDTPVTITVAAPTGFTDTHDSNNVANTVLAATSTPPSTDVDVALTGLSPATVRPQSDDRYDLTGTVSVTGPAAAAVQDVTYTVSGAEFVTGTGPATAVTRPASDTTPTFTLVHRGAGQATITASVAPTFNDTLSLNDSASADLRPYDVSLSGLTPTSATADQSGDQTFTATLDDDGFPGSVGFSVVGGQDPALTHWTISGSTVTFTVHSGSKDQPATGFAIRTALPGGFTDYTPGNDSASSTYTYAATPPPPVLPFAFSGSPTATAAGPNDYDVVVPVENVPAGATQVVLSLPSPQEKVNTAVGPCTVTGTREVTCPVPSGATSLTMRFNAQLPGKSGSAGRNPVEVTAGTKTVSTEITFP